MPDLLPALDELTATEAALNEMTHSPGEALNLLTGSFLRLYPQAKLSFSGADEGQGEALFADGRQVGWMLAEVPEQARPILNRYRQAATHQLARHWDQQRHREKLELLGRSGELLSSRLSLQQTLISILDMALEVTGARYGIFRLVNAEGTHLVTAAVRGEGLDRPMVEALPLEPKNIMGCVATNRSSVLISDLHKEPWSSLYFPLDQLVEMRSELATPLLGSGGRLEGVLNLESTRPGAFNEDDKTLLESFASQAVVAICQARLLDALQELAEHLLTWPCRQVLQRILELACDLLNANGARLRGGKLQMSHGTVGEVVAEQPLGDREPNDELGVLQVDCSEVGEWGKKVMACLAHLATLALSNEHLQQRRAVAETFAALGDMAANLLHQLNNKIGIIPVRVQGVQQKCAGAVSADPYLDRNLEAIRQAAVGAMDIVRDHLGILRPLEAQPVDLGRCIDAARSEVNGAINIELELPELPKVRGEFRSLVLIFLNLFQNAAEATEGRGRVSVKAVYTGSQVKVAVEDDGPGIAPAAQQRVFELNLTESRPAHLGFGLWWVRTLMDRLGGSITLQSDGSGGTLFELTFPEAT